MKIRAAAFVALAFPGATALAQDIGRITGVTLYPGSATVERPPSVIATSRAASAGNWMLSSTMSPPRTSVGNDTGSVRPLFASRMRSVQALNSISDVLLGSGMLENPVNGKEDGKDEDDRKERCHETNQPHARSLFTVDKPDQRIAYYE